MASVCWSPHHFVLAARSDVRCSCSPRAAALAALCRARTLTRVPGERGQVHKGQVHLASKAGSSLPLCTNRFVATGVTAYSPQDGPSLQGEQAVLQSLQAGGQEVDEEKPQAVGSQAAGTEAELETQEVLKAAWEILDHFNQRDIRGGMQDSLQSPGGIAALKFSVLLAVRTAAEIEGVLPLLSFCCGSTGECHVTAQEWTSALGFSDLATSTPWGNPLKNQEGPVYMKLNVSSRVCYASPYPGKFRGVIIQLADRQVGHLPLRLFKGM